MAPRAYGSLPGSSEGPLRPLEQPRAFYPGLQVILLAICWNSPRTGGVHCLCNDVNRSQVMPEIDTKILPLLPLTTGVVLPGMVVTLTLESDEAKRAVAAARATDGQLLLVPRTGSAYARIGTVATVEDVGVLPSGMDALVIRGTGRARVGLGVPGTGDATWVQVEDAPDEGSDTP